MNETIMKIHPMFKTKYEIMKSIPVLFILLVIITNLIGEKIEPMALFFARFVPSILYGEVFSYVMGFFTVLFYPALICLLWLLLKKQRYKRITVTLSDKGISDKRDFIGFHEKKIKYKDIKEVIVRKGLLQRMFGLANIYIVTHATIADSGCVFRQVKNYEEVYNFLMSKIAV